MLVLPLLVLAACGDDPPPAADSVPPQTLPPVTTQVSTDDVVMSVDYEGGFAPVEMLFSRTPVAMITGDGMALSTGPVPEIFPGPLLPNVLQRTITPEATQELVALADELGLLADITYAPNNMVADAPDTVVTITVDGTTYVHRAYALGIDDEPDPARDNLNEFVTAMIDLPATVGADQLGPEEPYVADEYLIRATPVDPATLSVDVEPTIVEWPAGRAGASRRRLRTAPACRPATVTSCSPTPIELTFFTDGGVTYQVSAVPRLPGRAVLTAVRARRRSAAPRRAPSCGTPPRRRRGRSPR